MIVGVKETLGRATGVFLSHLQRYSIVCMFYVSPNGPLLFQQAIHALFKQVLQEENVLLLTQRDWGLQSDPEPYPRLDW